MKTTKADFELFKKYVQEYADVLGVKDWSLHFSHDETDGVYARTMYTTNERVATIVLGRYWDDLRPKNSYEIKRLAFHELMHVVMAPLVSEAKERYTTPYMLDGVEHNIIRQLENIVSRDE